MWLIAMGSNNGGVLFLFEGNLQISPIITSFFFFLRMCNRVKCWAEGGNGDEAEKDGGKDARTQTTQKGGVWKQWLRRQGWGSDEKKKRLQSTTFSNLLYAACGQTAAEATQGGKGPKQQENVSQLHRVRKDHRCGEWKMGKGKWEQEIVGKERETRQKRKKREKREKREKIQQMSFLGVGWRGHPRCLIRNKCVVESSELDIAFFDFFPKRNNNEYVSQQ
jgi:hypothetical protein